MPQSAGSVYMAAGFEGQLASGQNYTDIRGSYDELIAGVAIPFGRAVKIVSGKVQPLAAAADTVAGISIFTNTFEKDRADTVASTPANEPIALLKKGIIFMIAEEAVAVTDTVFVRCAAAASPGTYDAIGRVRNDVQTESTVDKAISLSGKARFVRAAAAGQLVPVEVNFEL